MRKTFLAISIVALFLISPIFCNALHISEIMFNPAGSDSGREWIEIKIDDDECINLTRYKLFEEGTNHNIYLRDTDLTCQYAIICNDINAFLEEHPTLNNVENITIYRSSFSLSNVGEEIAIKDGNEFIDYINYSMILDYVSVTEGHSLEYFDGAWRQSKNINGTPGKDEEITIVHETSNLSQNISINMSQNISSEISENISTNESLSENITQDGTNNTTNNITFNNTNNENYCNVSISILIKNESTTNDSTAYVREIYDNGVPIKFFNKLLFENKPASTNYSIEYWIEDINGEILKSKITTENQGEKTFTPKIEESDKIIAIKNTLRYSGPCNITAQNSEKILLIRNPSYTKSICIQSKNTCAESKTKCEPCSYTIPKSIDKNCSQRPIINLTVCNNSDNTNLKTYGTSVNTYGTTSEAKTLLTPNTSLKNSNISAKGQTTGMIIYESPNVKNRFYAIIGFLLVGLTVAGIGVYKIYIKYKKQ